MDGTGNLSLLPFDALYKVVLVGDSGIGKTSLLQQFAEKSFSDKHRVTPGLDIKVRTLTVDGVRVKLQIWDTAGQERFRFITKGYYRNADGIIIAYDVTNAESFANTRGWIDEVKSNCHGGDHHGEEYGVPIVLAGNKCDVPSRVTDFETQQKYAARVGLPFFETSAREDTNVEKLFTELTRLILARQQAKQENLNRQHAMKNTFIKLDSPAVQQAAKKKSPCCKS